MMLSSRLLKASRFTCIATAAFKQSTRPFFSSFTGSVAPADAAPVAPADDAPATESEVEHEADLSSTTTTTASNTLFRRDIIEIVAEEHDMSKAQASRVLATVLDTIVETVSEKKVVKLYNFGAFQSINVKAKKGYNLGTKEMGVCSPYERVKFKAFPAFKKSINNSSQAATAKAAKEEVD